MGLGKGTKTNLQFTFSARASFCKKNPIFLDLSNHEKKDTWQVYI